MRSLRRPGRRERGFTLVEALVTVALLALVMIAFLSVVDASSKVAVSQNAVSDLTENLRFASAGLVRVVRMAGTGGMPVVANLPDPANPGSFEIRGLALLAQDNVAAGTLQGGRAVVQNTDVLHVRGVLTGSLLDVNVDDLQVNNTGTAGTLRLRRTSPSTGQQQELPNPPDEGRALVLSVQAINNLQTSGGQRQYGQYRVLVVGNGAAWDDPSDPANSDLTIPVKMTGDSNEQKFLDLNEGGQAGAAMTADNAASVITAGLFDDLVYFVGLNPNDEPSLYQQTNNGTPVELIPNIVDLQVGLGHDIDGNGVIADAEWFDGSTSPTVNQRGTLVAVRLNLVARGSDPDPRYTFDLADYTPPENGTTGPVLLDDPVRGDYRFRTSTTEIQLRSHPPLI